MGKPQGVSKWCLTLPRSLSPLHMEAPRRKQATLRGRMRLMCGSPSMSILSEAFSVSKYQKYMEGVIRAHSGSGGTWLWTCLLHRVTPSPTFHFSFPFPFPLLSSFLQPFSSYFPPLFRCPLSGSPSPNSLEFISKGHCSHGRGYWKD